MHAKGTSLTFYSNPSLLRVSAPRNISQYSLLNLDGRLELELHEVALYGNEAPEEGLAHVGSVDAVMLVDVDGGGHFCRRVKVGPVQLSLSEVLVLK